MWPKVKNPCVSKAVVCAYVFDSSDSPETLVSRRPLFEGIFLAIFSLQTLFSTALSYCGSDIKTAGGNLEQEGSEQK